jgi:hypothetical protein
MWTTTGDEMRGERERELERGEERKKLLEVEEWREQ